MNANEMKNKILSMDDLKREKISIPEWGLEAFMRSMTAIEVEEFQASINNSDNDDYIGFRAKLVSICLVADDGQRVFSDEDVEALNQKSSDVIGRLAEIAQKLNGLTADAVEEEVKN